MSYINDYINNINMIDTTMIHSGDDIIIPVLQNSFTQPTKADAFNFLCMIEFILAIENGEDFVDVLIEITNKQHKKKTGKDTTKEQNDEKRSDPVFLEHVEELKEIISSLNLPSLNKLSTFIKIELRAASGKESPAKISVPSDKCSEEETEVLKKIGFSVMKENDSTTILW